MANDENKIILEFPATNVEIEFGETITFDNISGFLDSGRVTYNDESLTEEIAHLEDGKADQTYVDTELDKKADKSNTYTKSEVDTLIDNLPEPMIFKGTLGVGGTIQTLPAASASNEGWTYKVITDGTYAGQTAKVGDVFTSNGSDWVLIPSGDEDNDTWRAIKVEGVEVLGNGISSGAVDFVGSENIEVDFDGNGNKVGVKTKNIYTKTEVDDIVYNILPDDTASGSVANFETDLALPLKSLKIDVNAKQDLHGYDRPWTAGGGVNKFNISDYENLRTNYDYINNSYYCREIKLKPNTTYTASLHSNTTSTVIILLNNVQQVNERGFLDFRKIEDTKTFTTDETGNLYIGIVSTITDLECNERLAQCNVQIEEGSTATSWTPYENICPIEGWSEIKIARARKNLLDESKRTNLVNNIRYYVTNGVLLKAGTYTLSISEQVSGLYIMDSATNRTLFVKYNSNFFTFSLTKDTKVWIDLYKVGINTNDTVQLEVGSTATEYEPYVGNEYIINLGGTYYGGHFTQDKAGHRQFEVTHGIKLFGDISFNRSNNGGAWQSYLFYAQITDKTNGGVLKCSNYEYVVQATSTMQNEKIISVGSSKYIYVRDDAYTTVADFKTANANTQLVYPLATPYTIDLPDGEPIITLVGTNNIYADTGDTSVVFKDSVSGYVEKKIASVQALALNT